jgi:hypothetical protein
LNHGVEKRLRLERFKHFESSKVSSKEFSENCSDRFTQTPEAINKEEILEMLCISSMKLPSRNSYNELNK